MPEFLRWDPLACPR